MTPSFTCTLTPARAMGSAPTTVAAPGTPTAADPSSTSTTAAPSTTGVGAAARSLWRDDCPRTIACTCTAALCWRVRSRRAARPRVAACSCFAAHSSQPSPEAERFRITMTGMPAGVCSRCPEPPVAAHDTLTAGNASVMPREKAGITIRPARVGVLPCCDSSSAAPSLPRPTAKPKGAAFSSDGDLRRPPKRSMRGDRSAPSSVDLDPREILAIACDARRKFCTRLSRVSRLACRICSRANSSRSSVVIRPVCVTSRFSNFLTKGCTSFHWSGSPHNSTPTIIIMPTTNSSLSTPFWSWSRWRISSGVSTRVMSAARASCVERTRRSMPMSPKRAASHETDTITWKEANSRAPCDETITSP
mmetsp:Transcript_62034/g.170425  ORF Transcript_62034/g.170425 Transcript_62034/m.170425 type:complete len:362 (+) Transcript_62034:318-1403(+)